MAKPKKKGLPFDSRGGVVRFSRHLLDSAEFARLSAQAKALAIMMQTHWRPDRPVGYGVREAQKKIPCSRRTAMRVFAELQEAGFIIMVDESLFCSRTGSRTRTWRLTWLPYGPAPDTKPPTNEWEKNSCA